VVADHQGCRSCAELAVGGWALTPATPRGVNGPAAVTPSCAQQPASASRPPPCSAPRWRGLHPLAPAGAQHARPIRKGLPATPPELDECEARALARVGRTTAALGDLGGLLGRRRLTLRAFHGR
jgi:hypothetical protein